MNLLCPAPPPGQLRLPSPPGPGLHHGWRGPPEVVGQAKPGHRVDQDRRQVDAEAPLAGAVVVREGVVVVVVALAESKEGD